MSIISDALAGFKTQVATVDPSPSPGLVSVWQWPVDYELMSYHNLPVCVVAQTINRPAAYAPLSYGLGWHQWDVDLVFILDSGPVTDYRSAKLAEAHQHSWVPAIAAMLSADKSIGGTVHSIGGGGNLFTYRIGGIEWDAQVFWGIRVTVPVVQAVSL